MVVCCSTSGVDNYTMRGDDAEMLFYILIAIFILIVLLAIIAYFYKLLDKNIYIRNFQIGTNRFKLEIETKAKDEPPEK